MRYRYLQNPTDLNAVVAVVVVAVVFQMVLPIDHLPNLLVHVGTTNAGKTPE